MVHGTFIKGLPSLKDNRELNAKVREELRKECTRIKNYAKDHHRFAYKDRTGQLTDSISIWGTKRISRGGIAGYTMNVGIKEEPLYRPTGDSSGYTTLDLFGWLTEGTEGSNPPPWGYFHFKNYLSKPGNAEGGKAWILRLPTKGIEARTDFIKNAFVRTRKQREQDFANLAKQIGATTK